MSRTLEPTLYSLLPSYSDALPQPLLELASSLLAQSRNSANALKAEEEVARSYACAHIACERLKISLDLPPIQARPPIPPRLYKRLYAHLDNVLPQTSVGTPRRVRTPSSKARGADLFGSEKRVPSRATPSKESTLAKFRSPAARGDGTPTKSAAKPPPIPAKRKAGGIGSTLPAWIRPTIQLLCKELDQERIGRTVLAGMQTIVAPNGRRTKDAWVNGHLTHLLAGVHCLVAGQLFVFKQGKELDSRQYTRIRKSVLKVLEQAQDKIKVQGMDEDELWIGWSDVAAKDVDKAMAEVIKKGWQKEDWFVGFEESLKAAGSDSQELDIEVDDVMEEDEGDGQRAVEKLHIQRADTMFQTRWDMTDEKRAEYRKWKEEMLRLIKEKDRLRATEMDVDVVI
ncbi:hypothetical protein F5Y18DRAFT_371803 [Xylariaceae sp. FL1019]|nr:hypothetical protein F5Y18DRAFT_371803 [Xylariaceae sp. FL1019]